MVATIRKLYKTSVGFYHWRTGRLQKLHKARPMGALARIGNLGNLSQTAETAITCKFTVSECNSPYLNAIPSQTARTESFLKCILVKRTNQRKTSSLHDILYCTRAPCISNAIYILWCTSVRVRPILHARTMQSRNKTCIILGAICTVQESPDLRISEPQIQNIRATQLESS